MKPRKDAFSKTRLKSEIIFVYENSRGLYLTFQYTTTRYIYIYIYILYTVYNTDIYTVYSEHCTPLSIYILYILYIIYNVHRLTHTYMQ